MRYNQLNLVSNTPIMKRKTLGTILLPVLAIAGLIAIVALKNDIKKHANVNTPNAANAGLTVPAGFSAAIIADNLGGVRHIAVTPQNEIYVKLKGLKVLKIFTDKNYILISGSVPGHNGSIVLIQK